MILKSLVLVGTWVGLMAVAQAVPPYNGALLNPFGGFCSQYYRWDSFGKGLESAFKGTELRPAFNDEGCFRLGYQFAHIEYGERLKDTRCKAEFTRGMNAGIKLDLNTNVNPCYDAGYTAGVAVLHVDARERKPARVGQNCVTAYNRGSIAGKANTGMTPPSDRVESECYETGYADGQMFKSVAP